MLRNPFVASLLVLIVATMAGCSKTKTAANKGTGEAAKTKENAGNDINNVESVPPEGNGLTSPAKQELGSKFDQAMDPSSITSEYLKSLKSAFSDAESLKTASELLTSKARSATHSANVDVSLPGTVNAKYVVHQAKYVTNEKNVAHVLTSWSDEIENEKYEYDVTWVLKNEPSVGWRVAGMVTTGDSQEDTIVFNFEDAADIVSKGAPEGPETQTAEQKGNTEIR